ncbi:hypothetical protein N7471_013915 [Penicillium samsonianum]|uniref:uncharacterized protein n=1 Tax=Penicillium samsonianum TaxID=1882272 RepID=UPI002547F0A1|nr:uncharacterized protein N7471_013915 [Penicillium samsonianum]KAJ6118448.1 hypothetical protein N7471_013915 [Penicillium samsonianum]
MATCQSSTYNYAQSFSDQLVGEAMFRANVTLALARSSEPHNLLSHWAHHRASDRYFAPIYGAITAAVPLEQSNKRSNPAV